MRACVSVCVCVWGLLLVAGVFSGSLVCAQRQASHHPPATASFLPSPGSGAPEPRPAQCAGAKLGPPAPPGPSGAQRGRAGPGWCAGVPRVPRAGARDESCARKSAGGPPLRPRRLPAWGPDQAACERRDSCSCLKYAGYFYLPTSGSEGHPTSGRGGCYTMFPFSREGKWRKARLPDHMVLKSMKKN